MIRSLNSKPYHQNLFTLLRFKKSLVALTLVALFSSFFAGKILAQIQSLYNPATEEFAGISSLMSAVANNDVNGVKFFSKAGALVINQRNKGGATALHIASREGNLDIVKILVENGANLNIADAEGYTPLMRGAIVGNAAVVEFLLSKGAKAGLINSLNESALIHAVQSKCNDCLNFIIDKGNLINTMDVLVLKGQVADAFLIAGNQENQGAQNILESFLQYIAKIAPLTKSQLADNQFDQATLPLISKQPNLLNSKKTFKNFTPKDQSSFKEADIIEQSDSYIPLEDPKKIILQPITPKDDSAKKTYSFKPQNVVTPPSNSAIKEDNVTEMPLTQEIPTTEIAIDSKLKESPVKAKSELPLINNTKPKPKFSFKKGTDKITSINQLSQEQSKVSAITKTSEISTEPQILGVVKNSKTTSITKPELPQSTYTPIAVDNSKALTPTSNNAAIKNSEAVINNKTTQSKKFKLNQGPTPVNATNNATNISTSAVVTAVNNNDNIKSVNEIANNSANTNQVANQVVNSASSNSANANSSNKALILNIDDSASSNSANNNLPQEDDEDTIVLINKRSDKKITNPQSTNLKTADIEVDKNKEVEAKVDDGGFFAKFKFKKSTPETAPSSPESPALNSALIEENNAAVVNSNSQTAPNSLKPYPQENFNLNNSLDKPKTFKFSSKKTSKTFPDKSSKGNMAQVTNSVKNIDNKETALPSLKESEISDDKSSDLPTIKNDQLPAKTFKFKPSSQNKSNNLNNNLIQETQEL